jgi:pyruvate dehydrogenase E2 component (dihydrolipoamide acetyltransferase)
LQIASESGVPLAALAAVGTGPGGRVVAADVREFVAKGGAAEIQAAPSVKAEAPSAQPGSAYARGAFVDVPHTQMRRVIAHRLTLSKQTVPHYTLTSDINLDTLLGLRQSLNADLSAESKLSVNDFLIKAAALSCRKVPEMNSSWLEHGIRAYDYVDIAVAVAVPEGLITPIVKDADRVGLLGISRYSTLMHHCHCNCCTRFDS